MIYVAKMVPSPIQTPASNNVLMPLDGGVMRYNNLIHIMSDAYIAASLTFFMALFVHPLIYLYIVLLPLMINLMIPEAISLPSHLHLVQVMHVLHH